MHQAQMTLTGCSLPPLLFKIEGGCHVKPCLTHIACSDQKMHAAGQSIYQQGLRSMACLHCCHHRIMHQFDYYDTAAAVQ
jgi:hypothetical protein